jgi:hypothetical protein
MAYSKEKQAKIARVFLLLEDHDCICVSHLNDDMDDTCFRCEKAGCSVTFCKVTGEPTLWYAESQSRLS